MGERKLIAVVIALIIGVGAGFAFGSYQGFRKGFAHILNEVLAKDARDVGSTIQVLRHLRTGERDHAVEKLEGKLSDTLIAFDPDRVYPDLSEQTKTVLRDSIAQAKQYRTEHPRPEGDMREKMVQSLFSRD